MTFSARSFADCCSSSARAQSSSYHKPLGAVPFIGLVSKRSPSSLKKSSGDKDRMLKRPALR